MSHLKQLALEGAGHSEAENGVSSCREKLTWGLQHLQ